ncbi:MAG: hypothetical protein WC360_03865 [Opitutales bacterium]|jgi:hypothetical protein
MIKISKNDLERVHQGDIFRNVEYLENVTEQDGNCFISKIVFPYCLVLTQDCDLAQDHDYRNSDSKGGDKILISVIIAPLYNNEHFKAGEHLSNLKLRMSPIAWKATEGNNIRNNQHPRYHYFKFGDDVELPDSVLDFKHYFTVKIDQLESIKTKDYIGSVCELYREDVSHRFSTFLSRIGLPD